MAESAPRVVNNLRRVVLAVAAGVAVYRGSSVLINTEFLRPVKAAAEPGMFIANCTFQGNEKRAGMQIVEKKAS